MRGAASEGFRLPGGALIAVIGMLVCVWLASNCTQREARDAAIAAGLGLAIFVYRG